MSTVPLNTLHITNADSAFIEVESGMESRLLDFRREESVAVWELRAKPGARSRLHRHLAAVYGFTMEGAWGHDETYAYRPGSYIYETPGVVHRFLNGPGVTRAFFVTTGDAETLDPADGSVLSRSSIGVGVERYFEACERAGLARPNAVH